MNGDMRTGAATKSIVLFSVPVILGNLFQQFYNTMDAVILGRFQGEHALAAIGVANPIMSVAIFLLFGMCIGISVLLAELYGAEDRNGFSAQTATALWIGVCCTLILTLLCFFGAAPLLRITQTPEEILPLAADYLRIIAVGLIFTFFYNFYSAALRALGDSRTPFYYLLFSSCLNILLDLLFVAVFSFGVKGAAWATVLAQACSSFLCIQRVYRHDSPLALRGKALLPVKAAARRTFSYSYSVALQQSCIYLGRLAVQSIVNTFGTSTIAAFNAATRIEYLAYAPMDGLSTAAATFYAQNKGAHLLYRIRRGFSGCLGIAACYAAVMSVTLYFFPEQIMSLFSKEQDAAVITEGARYLRTMSGFYFFGAAMYTMQGFFRGMGRLYLSLFSSFSQIALRIVIAYVFAPTLGILAICWATILGWGWMTFFQGILSIQYFYRTSKAARSNP